MNAGERTGGLQALEKQRADQSHHSVRLNAMWAVTVITCS